MKYLMRLFVVAACLTPVLSVKAQTLISDFSSGSGFGSSATLVGSSGAFTIQDGFANFTVSSPSDSELVYVQSTGVVGSYTSNWTVRIDVYYADPSGFFSGTDEQAINVGLMVVKTGVAPSVSGGIPAFNSFVVTSNLFYDGAGGYSREARTSVIKANEEPADNETRYMQESVSGASVATVFITFNATSKLLQGGYDANGATDGYTFAAMNTNFAVDTLDVDGTTNWLMTGSDTFSIYLFGNSLYDGAATGVGPTLGLGDVQLDTFSGSGAGLTAVPEPSTYAAIAGALALGAAAWRRRQHNEGN